MKYWFQIGLFLTLFHVVMASDLKDGKNVFYYDNGNISSEGLMQDGMPIGVWKNYYETGILRSEGKRSAGKLDSIWVFYTELGDTLEKINYLNGLKNGYHIKFQSRNTLNGLLKTSKELYINGKKEGRSFYYYESGALKQATYYENDLKHQSEYIYNKEGLVQTIKTYRKGRILDIENINRIDRSGLKFGLWRTFYDDYRVHTEITYIKGKKNGVFKEYAPNGKLLSSLIYKNDVIVTGEFDSEEKVEVRTQTYANGDVKYYGTFRKNKPIGMHNYYDTNQVIVKSMQYNEKGDLIGEGKVDEDGNKQGVWKLYLSHGKRAEGPYKNNGRHGKWTFYFAAGAVEQSGTFKNNKHNGTWKWYFPDGKLQIEESFLNGQEDGLYTEYNEYGNVITKGEFIDGEKDGKWKIVYGDIIEEGAYISGLKNGKWKQWYDPNSLKFEGNYIQGNEDGKHTYYFKDGSIEEEQFYANGLKDKTWKKYNKLGNLIRTITYINDYEVKVNGVKLRIETPGKKRIY